MTTFFVISGIDDDKFPPEHPDVIRYYDKSSAEKMLKFFQEYGAFIGCTITEHNESILSAVVTT